MRLVSFIVILIFIDMLLRLVHTNARRNRRFWRILNIVVVICVGVWLWFALGIRKSGEPTQSQGASARSRP